MNTAFQIQIGCTFLPCLYTTCTCTFGMEQPGEEEYSEGKHNSTPVGKKGKGTMLPSQDYTG